MVATEFLREKSRVVISLPLRSTLTLPFREHLLAPLSDSLLRLPVGRSHHFEGTAAVQQTRHCRPETAATYVGRGYFNY